MKNWILASRPKTLTAALVPILVASALAFRSSDHFELWISILALMAALLIQIGTNFVNDAMDFKKGADTQDRIGPQRITASGYASPKKVLMLAATIFLLAILMGVPLVVHGGLPIAIVGLISVLCGYAYTSGPLPLAYKGLGEVFVILFFGIVAVLGLEYLHRLEISFDGLVLGLQMGFLSSVLIAINNYRDIDGDRKVNKMTLAARFGNNFAKNEIYFFIIGAFALNIYWISKGNLFVGLLPMLSAPLALKILRYFSNAQPSPEFNNYLGKSAGLHLIFGILLTLGLLI